MKRLFTIAALTVSLLTLLAACGKEATSTATPGLAQPTAQELKQAAQELWNTFSASIQTRDAAALHGIFVADLREQCTVEQMQKSLASGEVALPNAEVRTVYLDSEDPSNALMQLAMLNQPGGNLEALALGFIFAFPLPMAREEGEWRLSLSLPGYGPRRGLPICRRPRPMRDRNRGSTANGCDTPTSLPTSGASTRWSVEIRRQRRWQGRIQCICALCNGHDVGGPLGALPPTGAPARLESATGNDE